MLLMGSLARVASLLSRSTALATPARLVAVGLPASYAGFVLCSDDPANVVRFTKNVPLRLARDVWAAAAIVTGMMGWDDHCKGFAANTDYKQTLRGGEPGDAEYEAAKRACHLRSAERLVKLCFANGGIYIKLGQHIGQLVRMGGGFGCCTCWLDTGPPAA